MKVLSNAEKTDRRRILLMPLVALLVGCGGSYGSISPKAYEYAKALYSVSNRQSSDKLLEISEQIDSAHRDGELTDEEHGWLREVLEDCQQGRWSRAQSASRRMMNDQIEK